MTDNVTPIRSASGRLAFERRVHQIFHAAVVEAFNYITEAAGECEAVQHRNVEYLMRVIARALDAERERFTRLGL